MILICRGSHNPVGLHFEEHEFFTKCNDYGADSHLLDERLILACDLIRDFYKFPVYITSSFRTVKGNRLANGAPNSFHLRGMAVDLVIPPVNQYLNAAILSHGPLFYSLRECGIGGFGIAHDFLHIDTRESGSFYEPKFGSFELWHYN